MDFFIQRLFIAHSFFFSENIHKKKLPKTRFVLPFLWSFLRSCKWFFFKKKKPSLKTGQFLLVIWTEQWQQFISYRIASYKKNTITTTTAEKSGQHWMFTIFVSFHDDKHQSYSNEKFKIDYIPVWYTYGIWTDF